MDHVILYVLNVFCSKTVLTILSDEKQGLKAMKFRSERRITHNVMPFNMASLPAKEVLTPMRMLIVHMPGMWIMLDDMHLDHSKDIIVLKPHPFTACL